MIRNGERPPRGDDIVSTCIGICSNVKSLGAALRTAFKVLEATQLEEHQIWWLISRLRSKANCKHQIWLTCNPDNSSWLLKYAMPYLYQEGHPFAGRPDKNLNGTVRWLVRDGNDIVWGNTKEELLKKSNGRIVPKSFRALFGTIRDNPVLRKMRPEYESTLLSLPRVEKERLYCGSWFAIPEGSGYFSREWVKEMTMPPPHTEFEKICRAYDFAGTLPNELNGGRCDYTASVKMGKLKNGEYVILDVNRHHIRFGDWVDFILQNAKNDGTHVDIILPEDPNPAAKAATQMMAKEIISYGFYVNTKKASSSKVDRFRPFSSAAQTGLISVVKNCATDFWNKVDKDNSFYYNELERFEGKREINDMADATADAFVYLASKFVLPSNFINTLKATDLSCSNPLLNI